MNNTKRPCDRISDRIGPLGLAKFKNEKNMWLCAPPNKGPRHVLEKAGIKLIGPDQYVNQKTSFDMK